MFIFIMFLELIINSQNIIKVLLKQLNQLKLLKEQLVYMKLKINRLESDNKHIEQKTINLKKALLVYG